MACTTVEVMEAQPPGEEPPGEGPPPEQPGEGLTDQQIAMVAAAGAIALGAVIALIRR